MTDQRLLFDVGPADGNLTDAQAAVLQAAQQSHGGITATDAGQLLHAHTDGHPCRWCKSRGREVLEVLKARGLVRRRKTGVYQVVRSAVRPKHDDIPY